MAWKRHAAGRCADGQGRLVADAILSISVTAVTYYRWGNEYGGLKGDQVKRFATPATVAPGASVLQDPLLLAIAPEPSTLGARHHLDPLPPSTLRT